MRWQNSADKKEELKNAIQLIAGGEKTGQDLVDELNLQLKPEAIDDIERKKASNEATALINDLKEKNKIT